MNTMTLARLIRWSLSIFIITVVFSGALMVMNASATASFPTDNSGSWNPRVPCSSPWIVRISDITDNMTGTASYNNSLFSPGITENPYVTGSAGAKRWLTPGATPSGWHSPGPSCTITNSRGQVVAAFVEIDGVGRAFWSYEDCGTKYDSVNGGSLYPPGHWCDSTGNVFDPTMVANYSSSCRTATDPTCGGRIHVEFDTDWMAAGYCGRGTVCDNNTMVQQTVPGSSSTLIDIQGFVYWDPDHVCCGYHSFSGWEIHPITAWRPHQTTKPDFTISANPSSMSIAAGSSGTATINLGSIDSFAGTVTLTASVDGGISSITSPTASLDSSAVTIPSGGVAASTLTVSTSLLTVPGTYHVTVTGTDGALVHSTTVTVVVTLSL